MWAAQKHPLALEKVGAAWSGSSVHWYLPPSIWVSQAWHWERDIVRSSFVAVGLGYASRNAVTGKQNGFLCCKILANVNKLSL